MSSRLSAMTAAPAGSDKQSLVELDRSIRDKMEKDRIPGVVGCIVNADGVIWADTYGRADLERRWA